MMCLKSVLIFLVLLPFPTAPPLFMILFVATMVHKLRPCVYCTVVLVLVFLSTCNNSFLSLSFPIQSSNGTTIISLPPTTSPSFIYNQTLLTNPFNNETTTSSAGTSAEGEGELFYSAPARRCWCDLNSGRLLWPVLRGYTLVDEAKAGRRQAREAKVKEEEKLRRIKRGEEAERLRLLELSKENNGVVRTDGVREGEEHLPELILADEPTDQDSSQSDDPTSHIWIPLSPGQEEPDSISNEDERGPTRTEHPDPQVEEEYIEDKVQEQSLMAEEASATPDIGSRKRTLWDQIPWFLRSPRGGQDSGSSDVSSEADGTDAPPPSVPQSPTDQDLSSPSSSAPAPDSPTSFPSPLPIKHWYAPYLPSSSSSSNRYDLRLHGIGVVLDFGFGRSEAAVKKEVEEWISWDERREREEEVGEENVRRVKGKGKGGKEESKGQEDVEVGGVPEMPSEGSASSTGLFAEELEGNALTSTETSTEISISGTIAKTDKPGKRRRWSYARKSGVDASASDPVSNSVDLTEQTVLAREL